MFEECRDGRVTFYIQAWFACEVLDAVKLLWVWFLVFLFSDENWEKSTMNQSCNPTTNSTATPDVSPIEGEKQALFSTSLPNILITNSTPSTTSPSTPRKRCSESLHESITPIKTRM